MIAEELNNRRVPGPRGAMWRDTAIRGDNRRGIGIINNQAYRGCVVFNRRNFRKNRETEKREARMNDTSEWVVAANPDLCIVDEALWERVKRRRAEVRENFDATLTKPTEQDAPAELSAERNAAMCRMRWAIRGEGGVEGQPHMHIPSMPKFSHLSDVRITHHG
ncbi:recombinase family protein [Rhizobium sp.]